MPRVAETVDTVFLVSWMKAVGEIVNEGEDLLEVDSDKAVLVIPSPASGKIIELKFSIDMEIKTGDIIAVLE